MFSYKTALARYSLLDNGVSFFLVTIAQLSDADEGVYQCAVDIPWAVDKYTEVYIKVTDGKYTEVNMNVSFCEAHCVASWYEMCRTNKV